MRALGVDAAGVSRQGDLRWAGVVLDDDGFVAAQVGSLAGLIEWADLLDVSTRVGAVGVDIPIGHVDGPHRLADVETRRFVQPLGSTVFPAPAALVLDAAAGGASYSDVNAVLLADSVPKMSKQAWALVPRMIEARDLARHDDRLHEVHPEASFRQMRIQLHPAEDPDVVRIRRSKKTWNGLMERRCLLNDVGIVLPDDDPVLDGVVSDDVVDAAAAAWSALRIVAGTAVSMPAPPERSPDGREVTVWR